MERKHTVALFFVSAAICALFCAVMPFLGIFSILILPAVYGVCLGASKNVFVAFSPIPGLLLAGLLWKFPAVVIVGLLTVIPGIVLAVCLRKGASVTVISVATAAAYAVIFGGVFASFAIVRFGSIPAMLDAMVSFFTKYVSEVFDYAASNDATGTVAEMAAQIPVDKYVASLVMLLPGTFIVICEVLGYILSHIARLIIRFSIVPDTLYPDQREITLPTSVAVLFLVSFAAALVAGDGVVYYVAENLNTVLRPALFVVGLNVFRGIMPILPSTRRVIFILFIVVLFVISPSAGVYSVCSAGVIGLIMDYFRRKRIK